MSPARIVIAGTSSGAGKTTVTCGLIGALARRGLRVQGFKVGPDYIDPTYHALASGRPGRNLDAFLSGPGLIGPLVRHGAHGADVAVIEGVMGLFDGASGRGELASTAQVAKLLRAPVVLVVDAAAMARSAAAIVHGYRSFDPDVDVAGVIFNRVGSDHHEELLREAVAPLGVAVLGALRRDPSLVTPERHLGLVPAGERDRRARTAIDNLALATEREVDLGALMSLASAAPGLQTPAWSPGLGAGERCAARIAIARGPAFSFHYQENLELLAAAGAELLPFDPTVDEDLPAGAGALIVAGGFPEVFAEELAANVALRARIAAFAASGAPVLAECGGLLFLADALDGHEMCGVLPLRGVMTERLKLGYREATAAGRSSWIEAGQEVCGHEFHYSEVEPLETGLPAAWRLASRGRAVDDGVISGGVHASYLHVHWAAYPELAERFASAAILSRGAAR